MLRLRLASITLKRFSSSWSGEFYKRCWPCLRWKTLEFLFSVDEGKQRLLEPMTHDASFPNSSCFIHVTLFWKKTQGISGERSTDNELRALLTLLSLLGYVVQWSPFYDATTAYTRRRRAIILVICNQATNCRGHKLLPVYIVTHMSSVSEWSCDMCFQEC